MRVAFISGCIEYSVCLTNALSKYCEIDFFYSGAYARQRDESILTLLAPVIGKVEINPYRLRDPRNFSSHKRLAIRFKKYDVIHMQGSNFWFSLNRYVCKEVPIICTIHDPVQHDGIPFLNRSFQNFAQKISISQAATFIVHGENLRNILSAIHRIPKQDIVVIPHGEFSFYKQLRSQASPARSLEASEKRLLFFGEVRKNKGLEYLIRAEPLISAGYDNYKIFVAGRFKKEPENNLGYYMALMRNPSRFEIINRFIGNHEVADIFEQSDIVVLPYISASQSGILALALGFGKPVVATDTGSIGEIVEHGRTGLLVPPSDERSLANALLELLRDDEKCSRFGSNAAAFAQEQLNWDIIAKQNLEVYEKTMAQNRKRG